MRRPQSATRTRAEVTSGNRPSRFARGWVSLPDRMLTWFLTICIVIGIALIIAQYRWWLVLPAFVVGFVLTRNWIPRTPVPNRAAMLGTGAALLIAVVWSAINIPLAAQSMGVSRDPGLYTLSGMYLIHHPSVNVFVSAGAIQVAHSVPGVLTDWSGYAPDPSTSVQGTGLVPGLIGALGWIFGAGGALHAVVAVGGICLVALYAVGRRILGPIWALLPVIGLAVAMPLVAFARVPYTEPSSLTVGLGAMLCVLTGLERSSGRLFLLAGLFAGASEITRVDGLLDLVGGVLAIGLVAMFAVDPARRQLCRRWLWLFIAGGAVTGIIGVLELYLNSPHYLELLHTQVYALVGAVVLVSTMAQLVSFQPITGRLANSVQTHRRGWSIAVGSAVAVAFAVLASRPLWMINHFVSDPSYVNAIAGRQRAEGLGIDGTRSYDEYTVSWLVWYFGWPVVIAAVAGVILLMVRAVRRRKALPGIAFVPSAISAILYLNKVSVTPDQMFAMRRLLPGVVPGLLLAAGYAFREVAAGGARMLRSRARLIRIRGCGPWWRRALAVAAVAAFVLPVTMWGSLFPVREGAGEQQFANKICGLLNGRRAVMAGGAPSFGEFLPTLQQVCDVQAMLIRQPTSAKLAGVATSWGDPASIVVLMFDSNVVSWKGDPGQPLAQASWQRWDETLMHRPAKAFTQSASVWMGILQPDGSVAPLGESVLDR
ncbi:MAG: glycosyltransferase family 39 protein [Actinomycetota bacterium]|nr:glycosyltransferase family 39 protein [Actinomycetota bacterium]